MSAMDTPNDMLPYIRIGDAFEVAVDWSREHLGAVFDGIADTVDALVEPLIDLLNAPPAIVVVLLFAVLGWWLRSWKFGLGTAVGLAFVAGTPFWEHTMSTLALVIVASGLALLLAVPLGILIAENARVSALVRPVLDLMQTLPAFVYLIPAIFFFGVGAVPGVLATVVFSMPPGVRLTELGLRQIDREVIEAGEAFGASPWTILLRTKLPLALPTIMTGVNQVIMLALSMVVIAGMVGAGGLGDVIITSFARVQVGTGFESGIAVVILAVVLDRLTDSVGARTVAAKAQRAMQQRA